MHHPDPDPLVGRTIAHYEVVGRLGGGGMGVVYAARDTKLGRRVALKFLPPQWSHDEGAKERFVREAQAASSTDHPNICTIHDIESADDGQLFIVMAHYEGQTLKQRLEAGRLPVEEAIDIAAQVAEGLARAHAQGVVHRDIKPGNLMLTEDGVKILDFGLAKFAEARFKLTLEGTTIGTIAYMSPEQARGEEADARSDVWALGVVLYEMLSGTPPFRGAYPEAIAHAIKTDSPDPLRASCRDIPEALEQIVFRAIHKNPAVRYQGARDLARALRQLQGRTIPLDLRTEPLPLVTAQPARRAWWKNRKAVAAAVLLGVVLVGTPLWLFAPAERIAVAVAPVSNHTGEPELDGYRLALTETLVDDLHEWPAIRVVPYLRVVEILRRFVDGGGDVSSRDAVEALATHAGVRFVVLPTLEYREGAWLARAEIRSVDTGTNVATYETDGLTSSLPRETAARLVGAIAARVRQHFPPRRPEWLGGPSPERAADVGTLEAARAFETGLNEYERLEYAAALDAFTRVTREDPQHTAAHAWIARTLLLMGQEREAEAAAQRAAALVTDGTPSTEATFVEAIAAEARRDAETAEEAYQRLVALDPQDPLMRFEWADFLRRRFRNEEAINAFHEVLRLDPSYVRPHVLLSQLYTRRNEFPLAERAARDALTRYRALGNRGGEAQALLYLAEALRIQGGDRLPQAAQHVAEARAIFESMGAMYNLARVSQFAGTIAFSSSSFPEAIRAFEQALTGARAVGNRQLEGTLLMNLGATHLRLRQRREALDYYGQSRDFYERIGDARRAAQQEVNIAGLIVNHGTDQAAVLRRATNARATIRQLGDLDFEMFATQVTAASYRYMGRHRDAIRELRAALNSATERQLRNRIASLSIDIARSHLQLNEYQEAQSLLDQVLGSEAGRDAPDARIELARVHTRTRRFESAAALLDAASRDIEARSILEFVPLLYLTRGELALESGRVDEARGWFGKGAALWSEEFADAESVEAACYEAWLTAQRSPASRAARQQVLIDRVDQARRMGHLAVEARCRLLLARTQIDAGQFENAAGVLDALPPEGDQTLGPELRAQVQLWRGRAAARVSR